MAEEALLRIERVWLIHDLFPGPVQSRTSRSAILFGVERNFSWVSSRGCRRNVELILPRLRGINPNPSLQPNRLQKGTKN